MKAAATDPRPVRVFKDICRGLNLIASVVILYYVAAELGWLLARPPYDYLPLLLATLSLLTGILMVTMIIHEGGHFLAARLQGMYVTEIRLLWLQLIAKRHGLKFRVTKRTKSAQGLVKAYPNPKLDLRKQMILFIAGGPAANLGIASLLALLALLAGWLDFHAAQVILSATALMNTYVGIANLFPINRLMPSDGARLYFWIFRSHTDPVRSASLMLFGESFSGLRSGALSERYIHALEADDDPGTRMLGGLASLRAAMDRRETSEALEKFDTYRRFYDALPEDKRKALEGLWKFYLIDRAYLEARYMKSPEQARREIAATDTPHIPRYMKLRAEAALHYAESAPESIRRCVAEARTLLADEYDAGTREEELAMLEDLMGLIKA